MVLELFTRRELHLSSPLLHLLPFAPHVPPSQYNTWSARVPCSCCAWEGEGATLFCPASHCPLLAAVPALHRGVGRSGRHWKQNFKHEAPQAMCTPGFLEQSISLPLLIRTRVDQSVQMLPVYLLLNLRQLHNTKHTVEARSASLARWGATDRLSISTGHEPTHQRMHGSSSSAHGHGF